MSVVLQHSLPVPCPEHKGHHHASKNHSNKRKAQRVQRACSHCRKRKQGCEEERPCKRCVEKGVDCVEVEPKRKRGRAKGQAPQRSRSDSRSGDEMADYDQDEEEEENIEDFCESDEDESLSDEDHTQNLSKGSSATDLMSSSINTTVHSLRAGDMNSSSPHLKADSSTPISNSHSSSSFLPILRSSSRSSSTFTEIRQRSSSVSSDITAVPESPESNDNSDVKEDPTEVVMEETDAFIEDVPSSYKGLNLALLIPFIGNLPKSNDQYSPMMLDDDFLIGTHKSSDSSTYDNMTYHPFDQFGVDFYKSQAPSHSDSSEIWNSDLPFYNTVSKMGSHPNISIEEGDTRAQTYLKECWEEFMYKSRGKSLDIDLQRLKESWKETIRCIRSLEWKKLQSSLKEMENLYLSDRFGQQIEPGMLFWTSGGRIHHANDSFCRMVGYSEEELRLEVSLDISPVNMSLNYGRKMRAHSIFHPDEAIKILKKQLEAVQSTEKSCYQMNTRLVSKCRQEIPVSCNILNIHDNFGLPLLTVAIFV